MAENQRFSSRYFTGDKKLMKNKRGSHIGFAIAFMLFISFVIFLFVILEPAGKVEDGKELLLNYLKEDIIENVSSELKIISVKINDGKSCVDENMLGVTNFVTDEDAEPLKIYSSSEFITGVVCLDPSTDYEIGLIRTNKYVFESKLLELQGEDYEDLKTFFNVPDVNDFVVNFTYSDKTEIGIQTKKIPQVNVFAESVPVTYFDRDMNINVGYIKVILW